MFLAPYLCSDMEETGNFSILEQSGTARVVGVADGAELESFTLDQIVHEHGDFTNVNIIKTDTDGFDFKVIRGASQTIKSSRPALLIEFGVFGNGRVKVRLREHGAVELGR